MRKPKTQTKNCFCLDGRPKIVKSRKFNQKQKIGHLKFKKILFGEYSYSVGNLVHKGQIGNPSKKKKVFVWIGLSTQNLKNPGNPNKKINFYFLKKSRKSKHNNGNKNLYSFFV
jgi:hypothetical protein